jgi:hypothetical protein
MNPPVEKFDSNEFAKGRYRPHGHSEVFTGGEIIWIETEGPFNLEAVVAIRATRAHLLETSVRQGRYAYLNKWRNSAMMPMEALLEYGNGLQRDYAEKDAAPCAIAWVFPDDIEGGTMMRPHYERLFSGVGIPFAIFADEDSALTWVRGQLDKK